MPLDNSERAEQARILLAQAQAGNEAAFGDLLELFRGYLLSAAGKELDPAMQAKAGPSDVVQDTFLEAQRLFDRFEGRAANQFLAWLRAILQHKLQEHRNRYLATQKRHLDRERSLDESGPQGAWASCSQAQPPLPASGRCARRKPSGSAWPLSACPNRSVRFSSGTTGKG